MTRTPRTIAGLLALATCLALSACGSSGGSSHTTTSAGSGVSLGPPFGSMTTLPGVLTSSPPWSNNLGELQQRLRKIGLPALTAEGQVVHIHQHLDVVVEGHPVTVPANIGIDASGAFISPLHTHDTTGVMHVESPTVSSFSLGEFFAVWGVRLDRNCIGGLCTGGGRQLRAWVNGHAVNADPARIVLDAHQEIVLAYGTAAQLPKPVPSSYDFPAGL